MLAVNVRLFLEQREKDLMRLIKNFQEQTLADEKAGLVYLSLVNISMFLRLCVYFMGNVFMHILKCIVFILYMHAHVLCMGVHVISFVCCALADGVCGGVSSQTTHRDER